MDELPEPLTPSDCDLRDYVWMPLDTRRLLTSSTWIKGSAEEKVAALNLWCESWHQVPAGSLPDDDDIIAHLSQARGGWKRVRDAVMRSWVKCADGRFYHPVVCEKARESWELKQAQRNRTEAARLAKIAKRNAAAISSGGTSNLLTEIVTEKVTDSVTENVTASTRPDQTRPEQERKKEEDAAADAAASNRRGCRLPPDWQPSPPGRAFCLERGLNFADTASSFRDYWHAKPGRDGTKLDWEATWRNWCRNQRKPAIQPKFRNGFVELLAEEEPVFHSFLGIEHVRN